MRTKREELVGNPMLQGSLGYSDHNIGGFKNLKAVRRVHFKFTSLAECGLFKDLLSTVPWDRALDGKGSQECWLDFKDHLFQAQEGFIQQGRNQAKILGDHHGWIRSC